MSTWIPGLELSLSHLYGRDSTHRASPCPPPFSTPLILAQRDASQAPDTLPLSGLPWGALKTRVWGVVGEGAHCHWTAVLLNTFKEGKSRVHC